MGTLMFLERTNNEDLTMLKLFISKLEEQMVDKGINFFDYEVNEEEIDHVIGDPEITRSTYDFDELKQISSLTRIRRVTIKFNSKAVFHNRFSLSNQTIPDDGTYTASTLEIQWDYLTNTFTIFVGSEVYEKTGMISSGTSTLVRKDISTAFISLDFGFKNRHEIQSMKVRLGKLYAKLKRDKELEHDQFCRKKLADIALAAFPDLIDSLILGGSDEEGNA